MTMHPQSPTPLPSGAHENVTSDETDGWVHPELTLHVEIDHNVVHVAFATNGLVEDSLELPLDDWFDFNHSQTRISSSELSQVYESMMMAIVESDAQWQKVERIELCGSRAGNLIALAEDPAAQISSCTADEWSEIVWHLAASDSIEQSVVLKDDDPRSTRMTLAASIFVDCLADIANVPQLFFDTVMLSDREITEVIEASIALSPIAPITAPLVAATLEVPAKRDTRMARNPRDIPSPPRGRIRIRDVFVVLAVLAPLALLPMLLQLHTRVIVWQAETLVAILFVGYMLGRSRSNRLGQFILQVKMARIGSAVWSDPLLAFGLFLCLIGAGVVLTPASLFLGKEHTPQAEKKGVIPKAEKSVGVKRVTAKLGVKISAGGLQLSAKETTATQAEQLSKSSPPAKGYKWIILRVEASTEDEVDVSQSSIQLVDSAGVRHLPLSGDGVINAPGGKISHSEDAFWNAGFQIRETLQPARLELNVAPTAQSLGVWLFPTKSTVTTAK